jgi:hypothetical protein
VLEKIRISLWDIFSFFLTGFLAIAIAAVFAIASGDISAGSLIAQINGLNAPIMLVAIPLAFTLFGMLIEPFANYADQTILAPVWKRVIPRKEKHRGEEELLAKEISAKYLGSLSGRILSPYAICKEYVETKQLSTTFMVYLSRYGFYRNCVFLALVSAIASLVVFRFWWEGCVSAAFAVLSAFIFKRRAEDFYSYMAPAVYRAFLIDKLNWCGSHIA